MVTFEFVFYRVQKLLKFFKNSNGLNFRKLVFVNIILIGLLSILFFWWSNGLGEDWFYHIRMASLIRAYGFSPIQDMRWFQLTTWSQDPADLSLGFHILLVPFISLFTPITAIKLTGISLILLMVNIFNKILVSQNIRFRLLWIFLVLFISTFFLYRLAIVRPFLISISLSLLIFYSLITDRKWLFALSCFLYPYFYSGWFQIFILSFFWILACWIVTRKFRDVQLVFIAVAAIAASLVLRPDFPNILILTYQQIVDLLFLNLRGIDLNVGIGQRPADIFFFQDNIISILLMALAVGLNFFNFQFLHEPKKKIVLLTLSFITCFYFFWSMESVRFIEYWIPFSLLFTAFSITYYGSPELGSARRPVIVLQNIENRIRTGKFWKVIFILSLCALSYHGPLYVLKSIKYSHPVTAFHAEANWLAENTPEGSNVFITSWDSFSRLFYHNRHNNYTVGMDPVFFYLRDPERFQLWRNITEHVCASAHIVDECSEELSDPVAIAKTIKSQFDSNYIFTNNYSVYYPFVLMMAKNREIFHLIITSDNSFLFQIDPSI